MVIGKLLLAIVSTLIATFVLFVIGCVIVMIRGRMLFGDFNPSKHICNPKDPNFTRISDAW